MPELVVRSEGDERLFNLESEDSVLIGRAPEAQIRIEDVASSRRHAQILRVKNGFELVDLGSRNGTLVNGVRRDRQLLRDGDVVAIGAVEIRYRDEAAADEIEIGVDLEMDEPVEGGVQLEDLSDDRPRATGSDCLLVFQGGDRDGERLTLGRRTTIGRKDTNKIVLRDTMVSSYHCEITREGGAGYVIRDLGSTNGTVVDAEPATEVALRHGSRIRVGAQRFVFLDPAVAEFEAALAAGDDGDAWGMMREIDTSAVRRRSPVGMIVLLLFLGLLAYGGYWTTQQTAGDTAITGPEGNVLGEFSYEAEGAGLDVTRGGGAVAAKSGRAHSGERVLALTRGDATGLVVARFRSEGGAPGVMYRLETQVRTAGSARAGLRLEWLGEDRVRTTQSAPVSSDGWTKLSLEATSPSGLREVRAALVLFEGDRAEFDDTSLVIVATSPSGLRSVESGEFVIASDERGTLDVTRSGRPILWNGRVTLGEEVSTHGVAGIESVAASDGKLTVIGSVAVEGGDDVPFSLEIAPVEEAVQITLKADAERAGLRFAATRGIFDAPVYVSTAGGLQTRADAFERIESAMRLTFQAEGGRVGLVAGDAGMGLAIRERAGGLELACDALVSGGAAGFELKTSFASARADASATFDEARRAAGEHPGEAYAKYGEAKATFPFDPVFVAAVDEAVTKLDAAWERSYEHAEQAEAAGRSFGNDAELDEASRTWKGLAERWAGLSRAAEAAARLQAVDELRAARAAEASKAPSAAELARAKAFEEAGDAAIARAIWRSIVACFPGTEAAAAAKQMLGN